MVSIREFSELLSSIRSTATEPSGWEVVLDKLSRLTNARTALIIKRNPSFTLHRIAAIGGTHTKSERLLLYPRSKKEYAEYYGSRDPFPLALRRSKLTGNCSRGSAHSYQLVATFGSISRNARAERT
jgi:hypothetical protein